MVERIDIEKYLSSMDLVIVGGESDKNGRVMDYSWVLDIREQCIRTNTSFSFRQCSTNFIKDGKLYHLNTRLLMSQAKKAGIDYIAEKLLI